MEINISLNTSQNSNVSEVLQFPAIVRIFTPILMVELLVGLVSNILLLPLLVKARRFQNNVNVYLCSMAVNNLLCLFPVSTSSWQLCLFLSCVNIFFTVVELIALIQQRKVSDVDPPLSFMFRLWFFFLPTSGPIVIFAVNKRFRVRIKELFKWQLKPDSATIHDVNSNTFGIVKHNSLRVTIPQHKCEGGTIEEPVIKPPLPNNILYNTWVGDSTV